MKFNIFFLLTLCLIFQTTWARADLLVKGINYDPVHSLEFAKAVGLDDKQGMIDAINADLDKLATLQNNGFENIRFIKTFFTTYSSLGLDPTKRIDINIADVVNNWNLNHPQNAVKLALGVYEFRGGIDGCEDDNTCKQWTQQQVNAAIKSANDYPNLLDRIIVGNEDLQDDAAGIQLQARIVEDINTIKSQINNKLISVGTAQTSNSVDQIFSAGKYANVKNAADFIGANVYPYWGGINYGDKPYINSPAKKNLEDYWSNLNHLKNNYEVIETEEGWPSDGYMVGQAIPSPDHAHDYLYYWYYRNAQVASISYYFALFDKTPGQGTESHWGIFSSDGNSSLLGSPENQNDYSKPLAKGHVLAEFDNFIGDGGGTPRVASVSACMGDWDPAKKTQDKCYPIDGYLHTGDIKTSSVHQFMIDTTGKTYASLQVTYYGNGNDMPRLCYIDGSSLSKMTNKSVVMLQWKTPDGAVPCDIK